MILAAGRGQRMLPLTQHTPKPLLTVSGKCLIDYQIERLAAAGIRDFVVNCGHFGEKIIQHLQQNCAPDHRFQFSIEGQSILETGGGIVKALPLLQSDPFIVVNADVWCEIDYRPLLSGCSRAGHLLLVDNPAHHPEGDFGLDKNNIINKLQPKLTFAGIGIYHHQLFHNPPAEAFPLVELLNRAASQERLTGERCSGYWADIGTPKRLQELQRRMDISAG